MERKYNLTPQISKQQQFPIISTATNAVKNNHHCSITITVRKKKIKNTSHVTEQKIRKAMVSANWSRTYYVHVKSFSISSLILLLVLQNYP